MNLSKEIAGMILDMLSDSGTTEIRRNDLAEQLGCVPSQINYVISSRFTPEHGYIVESRRGGSGYIRITRVRTPAKQLLMHTINAIGEEADLKTALAFLSNVCGAGAISEKTAKLIAVAIGDNALRPVPSENRNAARASILKHMLINTI